MIQSLIQFPSWCGKLRYCIHLVVACVLFAFIIASNLRAETPAVPNALEQYVNAPDASFEWKRTGEKDGFVDIEFTSQTWRGIGWKHHLYVYGEPDVLPTAPAILFLTGGSGKAEDLVDIRRLGSRAHVVAALLTNVPNQPLFEGKKEDSLVAYSLDQYAKTGDATWPVLFPMVKSVTKGMDALTAFTHGSVKKFILTGSSKRGWTSYLTAAIDTRVVGIAPRVFEMINIPAQVEWARRAYGQQSEKLQDFTARGLIDRIGTDPRIAHLVNWLDPYQYRDRYTIPKLILLGTNDRYWVVDSQRWYWNEFPGPKAIAQIPNLGHHLGDDALGILGAWLEYVAAGKEVPELSWEVAKSSVGMEYRVKSTLPASSAKLWKACAVTRDLREAPWSSEPVSLTSAGTAIAGLEIPKYGHCAYFVEVDLVAPSGKPFQLSTEAVVLPEMQDAPVIQPQKPVKVDHREKRSPEERRGG